MDTMDLIRALVSELTNKDNKTSLEKDILDTWNELYKQPFDEKSAKKQVDSNDITHPDICLTIATYPTTVRVSRSYQPTEADIKYNLKNQLILLASKEWEAKRSGQ